MNYEKAYKDALERARKMMNSKRSVVIGKQALETIFPELRESEDERIRKDIVAAVEMCGDLTQGRKSEIYAYLEKQKEQKHPNGCFTCDEYKKGYEEGRSNGFTAGYNKAMKEQKPAEWSEEDEQIRNLAIEWAETMSGQFNFVDMNPTDFRKIINWLKSLRPSWKPSEEQMDSLRDTIVHTKGYSYSMYLPELYEQLKAIKEDRR